MNTYTSIIKADYLQRTRSYSFLVTLLATVCLAYTFVPPAGASYSTVRVGNFIGENNAAWIGHITAIMASTFLWLLGFYLVNNGIKRDKETGVGQIVATTSISNYKYLLAKALSNFFVLLTITIIIMVIALSLVIIRGNNYSFDIIQFFFPYIFTTVPSIFFVSVLAVFAEVILGRYPVLQNIAFFILFTMIVGSINAGTNPKLYGFDVLGTRFLTNGMAEIVNSQHSTFPGKVSVGFIFNNNQHPAQYFLFKGTRWSAIFILSRLVWTAIAFILLLISASLFHRFDVKDYAISKKKKSITDATDYKTSLKEIRLSTLPVAVPSYGLWPFVKIELLLLFRKGPIWFWLVNAGAFIALFFIPLASAHQIALPLLWFLQINRWADIATKEKYNRTHYFTYAAYKPLRRLLTSQIIAGILLAIALAIPVIIRYTINGDYLSLADIISGSIFIVALAVCMGIISGGKRIFEITFFMLTYANISGATGLDYFGAFHHSIIYISFLLTIICILLLTAFVRRHYEIRHQ